MLYDTQAKFCWGLGLGWVLMRSQAQTFLNIWTIIVMFEFWKYQKSIVDLTNMDMLA
jgi:hypothetical protein